MRRAMEKAATAQWGDKMPRRLLRALLDTGAVLCVNGGSREFPLKVYLFDRRHPKIAAAIRKSAGYRWLRGFVVGHKPEFLCTQSCQVVAVAAPVFGTTRLSLDVLLHELIHVAFPDAHESTVEAWGSIFARVLWHFGWRKTRGCAKRRARRRCDRAQIRYSRAVS